MNFVSFLLTGSEIKIGEGYWKDVNGTVRYRLDIIDVRQSGVGGLVVIKGNSSVLLAVRLKVANQKITEIETIVTKNSNEGMLFNPDGFKPSPADSDMTKMPPKELLNTREEMIEIASKYPEAMKKGVGSFNKNGLYFSKNAYRLENGQLMAGPGCTFLSGCDNIGTQTLPKLPEMVYKVALVDEEAGIVFLRMNFGKGSVMSGSGTLDVFEAFKIYNDTMHCVYAIMRVVPEGTTFGWDYTGIYNRGSKINMLYANLISSEKGLFIIPTFPIDQLNLKLYSLLGKLIFTQNYKVSNLRGPVFLPLEVKNLPDGYLLGCIEYITENKLQRKEFFRYKVLYTTHR
ncbi:MAG: hypothetical protein N2053_06200 [Chitinispirillaceae bacterium]|nr:hypothetical protein [Chitinispirillaceae bacterium]